MNKQQLIDGIKALDPEFANYVDLENYSEEDLYICYERKLNAPPLAKKKMSGGWYRDFKPASPSISSTRQSSLEEEVEYTPRQAEQAPVSLSGFDALRKE